MSTQKTLPTKVKVPDFLSTIDHEKRIEDAKKLIEIMKTVAKEKPVMWGPSIIGFGQFEYSFESGQSGIWPLIGLSPRKANLVIYLSDGFADKEPLLEKLGKHKASRGCLYINKLDDVDIKVLTQLIKKSHTAVKKQWNVK